MERKYLVTYSNAGSDNRTATLTKVKLDSLMRGLYLVDGHHRIHMDNVSSFEKIK